MLDVQSNLFYGEGYAQNSMDEGGNHAQSLPAGWPAEDTREGGLATALLDATNRANDATLTRELKWQNCMGGDPTRAATFMDQVLNQQAFCAFAFMKGKSPAIHLAHLIGVFFGLSRMATDVQGKQIAFVGDRGNSQQPISFVLPPQNLWTWARARYLANTMQLLEHYALDKNWDMLWATGQGRQTLQRYNSLDSCHYQQ
jgi:hypothetical protein